MRTLNDAIERLYWVFSAPEPVHIDGCPHCIQWKNIGVLLGKSLRAITPQELAPYATSAFLTVGDQADYLYFLPRILEITATEPSWWPDPEVTGRAIRTAKPETWIEAQRTALNDYLESVVGNAIQSGQYYLIDDWICAIARMGFDVAPYLAEVAKCPAAVLEYFEANVKSLPQNKLTNAFWELPSAAHDAIVDWFFSEEISRITSVAYGYDLPRVINVE
jgi:hypothetical protein